jgi:hypothetical protein
VILSAENKEEALGDERIDFCLFSRPCVSLGIQYSAVTGYAERRQFGKKQDGK